MAKVKLTKDAEYSAEIKLSRTEALEIIQSLSSQLLDDAEELSVFLFDDETE